MISFGKIDACVKVVFFIFLFLFFLIFFILINPVFFLSFQIFTLDTDLVRVNKKVCIIKAKNSISLFLIHEEKQT